MPPDDYDRRFSSVTAGLLKNASHVGLAHNFYGLLPVAKIYAFECSRHSPHRASRRLRCLTLTSRDNYAQRHSHRHSISPGAFIRHMKDRRRRARRAKKARPMLADGTRRRANVANFMPRRPRLHSQYDGDDTRQRRNRCSGAEPVLGAPVPAMASMRCGEISAYCCQPMNTVPPHISRRQKAA